MTSHPSNDRAALGPRLRRYLSSCERALFGDGVFAFVAVGIVIAIWGFELVMNLRVGTGWVAVAHLAMVGPLWIAITALTGLALYRRIRGATRSTGAPEHGST